MCGYESAVWSCHEITIYKAPWYVVTPQNVFWIHHLQGNPITLIYYSRKKLTEFCLCRHHDEQIGLNAFGKKDGDVEKRTESASVCVWDRGREEAEEHGKCWKTMLTTLAEATTRRRDHDEWNEWNVISPPENNDKTNPTEIENGLCMVFVTESVW